MSEMAQELAPEIEALSGRLELLREEVAKVIVGQRYMVDRILMALVADGHILIEGIPGLAKTTAVKTVSDAIDTGFARIQFTPDLLPADLVGTEIYRPQSLDFVVKQGPIFTNLLLADEINRAPAKVQSALLEAMQERQVTIGETTFELPDPFLVLATQNPIEQEGTYPLPEAQVDRFMLKVVVGYPGKEEEKAIVERMARTGDLPAARQVAEPGQILAARALLDEVYVDEKVLAYLVDLAHASRDPEAAGIGDLKPLILYGVSPRGTIMLTQAARARAFLEGRGYVTPHDIKSVAMDVLRHRVITTYEAEAEGITSEHVIRKVLDTVPVP